MAAAAVDGGVCRAHVMVINNGGVVPCLGGSWSFSEEEEEEETIISAIENNQLRKEGAFV